MLSADAVSAPSDVTSRIWPFVGRDCQHLGVSEVDAISSHGLLCELGDDCAPCNPLDSCRARRIVANTCLDGPIGPECRDRPIHCLGFPVRYTVSPHPVVEIAMRIVCRARFHLTEVIVHDRSRYSVPAVHQKRNSETVQRLVSSNWWLPGRPNSQGFLARARQGAKGLTDAIMADPVRFFMQAERLSAAS
jgi:hypothetical protein